LRILKEVGKELEKIEESKVLLEEEP